MDNKKTGLGKGLSVLFNEKNVDMNSIETKVQEAENSMLGEVEIEKIKINPHQPRVDFNEARLKELAESIKTFGVIQPVTVQKEKDNTYLLISGERRLRASKIAGAKTIPAYIRKTAGEEANMLELALIENIQREDLNPMELSDSYQRLTEEIGLTQEQVADRVAKQRSTVANYLRLQKLPREVKESLRKGEISETQARTLLRLENPNDQLILWKRLLSESLTVRQLEEITKPSAKKKKKKDSKGIENWNPYFEKLEDKMRKFFGTRVKVNSKTKSSGEIVIEYYSNDDLERIMDKF